MEGIALVEKNQNKKTGTACGVMKNIGDLSLFVEQSLFFL